MKSLVDVTIMLCVAAHAHCIEFETLSTIYLPYTYINGSGQYELGKDAAEQMTFDSNSKLIYSVGHTNIHVIDITDVMRPTILLRMSYDSVDVTDVEVCGGYLFVAFDNQIRREEGFINVYKAFNRTTNKLELVHHIIVGDIPDMLQPTANCKKVIVAIEGEPYDDNSLGTLVDNPGGVGIITFTDNPAGNYTYKLLDFEKFNARYAELQLSGVRWVYKENNNTFANDVEPEYITINKDETQAYISLQENNAIALVDLVREEIQEVYGLGYKQWTDYTIDPSDRDNGIHMRPWPIYGMYQPDAIKLYTYRGVDYIITANEGDSKDYSRFSEEVRAGDLFKNHVISPIFEKNQTILQQMMQSDQLGRLKVTTETGKNETTGLYDRLYTFGSRSFSIRRADNMQLVYDSGDELEQKTTLLQSNLFNSNPDPENVIASSMDTRSDDKGPETESITVGHFGDRTLLLVGNERPGTIAVYSIDERLPNIQPKFETLLTGIHRTNNTWKNLYDKGELSMIDPEDMRFVEADQSPNGKPLLLVSGSVSGTVSILQINIPTDWEDSGHSNYAIEINSSKVLILCVCLRIVDGIR